MANYNPEIYINDRKISFDSPTYFIADIAANHDNDVERAKDLIWSAAEAGADAAKFQHFEATTIVSDTGFKSLGGKMSHQDLWEKSVYETYVDATLNVDWTGILAETCQKANIDFFTSPYSISLVDKVDPHVPAYKIGSGDITFEEIIEYISKRNKPVFLATGASTMTDVKRAIDTILNHNQNIVLMQCNTNYTGDLSNFKYINLNVLNQYSKEFPNMILGLSDHTPGHATVLGAIALGARVIEKHYTDDTSRKGPDHGFSMSPESWKEMVRRSRELQNALGDGIKTVEENESETVVVQRRAIRAKKTLQPGHYITSDDVECLRPCPIDAIAPYDIKKVIGKKVVAEIPEGQAISWKLIS